MTVESLAVLAGGIVALGWAFWTYLRREPPVRGRLLLASLRAGTLLLVVVLLWNPPVPLDAGAGGAPPPRTLVDASLSMTAADTAGERAWDRAVQHASETAPGPPVLLFGSRVRTADAAELPEEAPGDLGSELAPALERAAELGADSVTVLSDFRLDDPVAAAAAVEATGLAVRYENLARTVRNAAVAEVDAPGSVEAGDTVELAVLLAGEGGGEADSVDLELRRDDRPIEALRVPLPAERRPERHRLRFEAPGGGGTDRVSVRTRLDGDAFAPDDERVVFVEVEPARSGVVLLSLRPDWEPRYLLPVLERATGLDGGGFFRLADGSWIPVGAEDDREGPAAEEVVRERAGSATLLVLHGIGAAVPSWIQDLGADAERLLLFPADREGATSVGLTAGAWREEEWYPVPDPPPSPLAGELAGVSLEGLPPLRRLLPLGGEPDPGLVPLQVRADRTGSAEPALVLLGDETGRRAVALASGFWRWGAREGTPREVYRRLWSGVTGWLLARPVRTADPAVEPTERPAPRGEPVEWRVRGEVGDTVRIRISAEDSALVDTAVAGREGPLRTRALDPGRYAYEVRGEGLPGGSVQGELEISDHSAEVLRPRAGPPGAALAATDGPAGASPVRRLRTHPAPYLVILLLLSAEWIGRRRQGLR